MGATAAHSGEVGEKQDSISMEDCIKLAIFTGGAFVVHLATFMVAQETLDDTQSVAANPQVVEKLRKIENLEEEIKKRSKAHRTQCNKARRELRGQIKIGALAAVVRLKQVEFSSDSNHEDLVAKLKRVQGTLHAKQAILNAVCRVRK